ncbi:uncharacterized protein LOC141589754 [Silene latifolia]|uniref:uncharacterized protein LOC141589754 n=1 Tax=Silene latifolia TaxID=37657 RepID=UPI003D77A835
MDKLVGDGEDKVYSFPRLKSLMLKFLNITHFASKSETELRFLALEKLDMSCCNKIQSFYSGPFTTPKLKQVTLLSCQNLQYLLSNEMNDNVRELPSLEIVQIWERPQVLSFSSEPLLSPKLHDVILINCPKMTRFLRGDPNLDDILDLPSLEIVYIDGCSSLHSFSSGGIRTPNLCNLYVDVKDYSKRANEELEFLLENLYKLHRRYIYLLVIITFTQTKF